MFYFLFILHHRLHGFFRLHRFFFTTDFTDFFFTPCAAKMVNSK